jgi:hypothetical protein
MDKSQERIKALGSKKRSKLKPELEIRHQKGKTRDGDTLFPPAKGTIKSGHEVCAREHTYSSRTKLKVIGYNKWTIIRCRLKRTSNDEVGQQCKEKKGADDKGASNLI